MLNLFSLDSLNIITFLWLAFWAWHSLKSLMLHQKKSIYFVIIVHFLFFGLPLLQDVVFGKPEYNGLPGFYFASRDNLTSVIYCFYVSVLPLFWLSIERRIIRKYDIINDNKTNSAWLNSFLNAKAIIHK